MRAFPPNYLVPSPNTMSRSSEPFRPSRPPSRASVAATFLVFLLTLSAGTPGFAQNPAPAVEDLYFISPPAGGVHILGNVVRVPLVSHIFRTTPATIGSQRGPVATAS